MRTALVNNKDGKVEDVIIHGPNWEAPKGFILVPSENANIGDLYDGDKFTTPEPASHPVEYLARKAKSRRRAMARAGVLVDIAHPGNDPILVNVDTTELRLNELIAFVHMAEADPNFVAVWVMDNDDVLTLNAAQIFKVRDVVFKHIAHTHAVLGTMMKAIETGHVAHIREVNKPETATAIELPAWTK